MKPFFHNKKADRFFHHLLRYGITKNRLFYKKTDLILQGQTYTVYGGGQWARVNACVCKLYDGFD